ncbi:MAG: hypothetical protein U9M95_06810, partial [Candidatus Altiarchaeota archaeon]|nr:hypothetical protein [Candidatus Altiarchaeota archaeon]
MELNININERHVHMILFVLVLGFASVLVFSQGTPIQGHPAEEITQGTFAGGGDYIFPLGSKVGIGETNPEEELHVGGNGEIMLEDRNTESTAVHFIAPSYDDFKILNWHDTLYFQSDTGSGLTPKMALTSDGKVGIGTKDPSDKLNIKLDVKGDIVTGSSDNWNERFQIGTALNNGE